MSSVINTQRKAIQLTISLGGVSYTFESGVKFVVERNFGDTSNNFTLDILDKSSSNSTSIDARLSAGARQITVQYCDSDSESPVVMNGMVWDYTSSFVGDLHQLSITGYVSKGTGNSAGSAMYNLDWNRYFWQRSDTKLPWGENNVKNQTLNGPGGSIQRSIPDIFVVFDSENPDHQSYENNGGKDSDDNVRIVETSYDKQKYVWVQPGEAGYSTGMPVKQSGRKPSTIVEWLCKLEGWPIGHITETATISYSVDFTMSEMTAEQYISQVLVTQSTTVDKKKSGFRLYWKDNKVNYDPVDSDNIVSLRHILLGYNVKNSPVISFQVNTKGTAMLTQQAEEMTGIEILTGEPAGVIEFSEEKNKTDAQKEADAKLDKTYNAYMANFLGMTEKDWREAFKGEAPTSISFEKAKELIRKVPASSGSADSLAAQASASVTQLKQLMIKAELNMWGDSRIHPAAYIKVTNLLKGGRQHFTSGDYLILKQTDTIDSSGFIQNLQLIKKVEGYEFFKDIVDDAPESNNNKEVALGNASAVAGAGVGSLTPSSGGGRF